MNKITAYYIGGRCGLVIKDNSPFRRDFIDVFFEADKTCIPQLEQICKKRNNEFYIYTSCLSDKVGESPFYIKYDPFASSLYDVNPKYDSYYTPLLEHDYLVSEITRVVETRTLKTDDLDSVVETNKIPKPDLLIADTQGSEYNILLGAKKSLDSVVGIDVEVSFVDLNKGQPLFGDIHNLLRDNFYFVGFVEQYFASPYRAPIGLRGAGFNIASRALFLRSLDTLSDYVALRKLAFVALHYSQVEYAIKCLIASEKLTPVPDDQLYMDFISEFSKSTKVLPEIYPKTFRDVFPTFEDSNNRFKENSTGQTPMPKKLSVDTNIYSMPGCPEAVLDKYGFGQLSQFLTRTRRNCL